MKHPAIGTMACYIHESDDLVGIEFVASYCQMPTTNCLNKMISLFMKLTVKICQVHIIHV